MSQRPSTLIRNTCSQAASNATGYLIIGDTAAAILYARRLLANGVTSNIRILCEGLDRTNVADLPDTDFIPLNNNTIFHFLGFEKIHLVTPGDSISESNPRFSQVERIYHYARELGTMADFIASPYIPRIGPWFEHSTQSRADNFSRNSTTRMNLSSVEEVITKRLSSKWGIPITNNIIVKQPSIAGTHHVMVKTDDDGTMQRELFLQDYHVVTEADNVQLVNGFRNLRLREDGCAAGLYNASYEYGSNSTSESAECVKVVWKTNPYTFLRLYTEATGNDRTIAIPTTYNFVASIPMNNTTSATTSNSSSSSTGFSNNSGFSTTNLSLNTTSLSRQNCTCCPGSTNSNCCGSSGTDNFTTGVNLTGQRDIGDLVTTDIAFSLPDTRNKKNGAITWAGHAFTTKENLATVNYPGQYTLGCNIILIVSAICYKNPRIYQYLLDQKEIKGLFNSQRQEKNYLNQFANICADVYNAYTGKTLNPEDIIQDSSVCTSAGLCSDSQFISDFSVRETPPGIFINTVANLYRNLETYNAAGNC